jgi:LacI family transcriptional regulator
VSDEQITIGERKPLTALAVYASLDEREGSMRLSAPGSGRPPDVARDPDPRLVGIVTMSPVLQHTTHSFYSPLLASLRARLLEAGCDVVAGARSPREGPSSDPFAVERWRRLGAAGLIAIGIGHDDAGLRVVLESGMPTVFVDLDVLGKRSGYVMSNNLAAMAGVVRHLHALGRRRIATITGLLDASPGADRLLGYRSGLASVELRERDEYVVAGDYLHRSGYEATQRLLALPEPPDAVAAASDTMAVGAIVAVEQAGLRVPADIAVTGFDDSSFARLMRPALTTVRQDVGGLGVAAAEALLEMLDRPEQPPPAVLLPTRLIVRESCGAGLALAEPRR